MAARRALILLLLALGGCVAQGPPYDPARLPALDQGAARILVFRESGLIGAAAPIPVDLDGQPLAALAQDGYAWGDVPAGRHQLSAANWLGTSRLLIDLPAGSIAYVEAGWGPLAGNIFDRVPVSAPGAVASEQAGPYTLALVDPAAAEDALARSRRSQ